MAALGAWIHDQEVPGLGKIMKYGLYTSRGTCQCSTAKYSAVGGQSHEAEDAAWLAAAGADYVKVDSCCGSPDPDVAFADYGRGRDGFNATGRPVYFSLCGWQVANKEKRGAARAPHRRPKSSEVARAALSSSTSRI